MSVPSVAATQVALTQARVQTEVAARLLKISQETGTKQALELVNQAAETITNVAAAQAQAMGHLDVYG